MNQLKFYPLRSAALVARMEAASEVHRVGSSTLDLLLMAAVLASHLQIAYDEHASCQQNVEAAENCSTFLDADMSDGGSSWRWRWMRLRCSG